LDLLRPAARFPCPRPVCDAHFSSASHARRHALSEHDGLRFPCQRDGCDAHFSDASSARRHALSVHDGLRFP
jgi:hypothetical protein